MLKPLRSARSLDEEELQEQWEADRATGHALFKMYERLYIETKITAAEFCIMNYYNDQLGSPGGDFQKYGLEPGKQTGRYQQFLDAVLPPKCPEDEITIP